MLLAFAHRRAKCTHRFAHILNRVIQIQWKNERTKKKEKKKIQCGVNQ